MAEKRFTLSKDTEWWFVEDNTIKVNEYGYRDDVTGEDKYRGLKQDLTEQEVVDLLNKFDEENKKLKEFQNKVFDLIDIKIEETNKKFQEYHPERKNDVFLERYRTLKNLKEELEE